MAIKKAIKWKKQAAICRKKARPTLCW